MISKNYEELENVNELYSKYKITDEEINMVVKLWRKAVQKG